MSLSLGVLAVGGVTWFVSGRTEEARSAGEQAAKSKPGPPPKSPELRYGSPPKVDRARSAAEVAHERMPAPPPVARPPGLTGEEVALLDHYGPEGLRRALAEAQNAYVTAKPSEAAEADRRYLQLLNLIAKMDAPPEPPSPELVTRQREYLEALPAEEARLADLPPEERAARLDEFKSRFFADLQTSVTQSQASQK